MMYNNAGKRIFIVPKRHDAGSVQSFIAAGLLGGLLGVIPLSVSV
jgi:hypothetical protein